MHICRLPVPSAAAEDSNSQPLDEDSRDTPPSVQREEATGDENAQDAPSTDQREETTGEKSARNAPPTVPLEEPIGETRPVTPSSEDEKEVIDDTDPPHEETALHRALKDLGLDDDSSPKLEKLGSEWKDMINIQSSEPPHLTPLHMAVERNFPKVAKRLVDCGADANIGSKREDPNNTRLPSFETDTMKAARLLFEIKDKVQLGLNGIVPEYQQMMQLGLNGIVPGIAFANSVDWDEDETAKYVANDIEELDRLAKKTEEALNTTITIYESEIGNLQAKEAAEQGKRKMVFTLVTVFFLPLSFLSSLFALDVNSFLEAPWWSLVVIFVVPLPFLHAANGHVKGRDPYSLYLLNKGSRDRIDEANKSFRKRLARRRANKNSTDASGNV
ncbi:hypothetical protein GQ607_002012 [Colletotrichum asianum]|uniref:Ankyrin repeat protein n=1 Tax=Colletotrichum asianum TaxID=702518 RepID=A0A8H3ZSV1_9PEZI|nr:hypothetical protein GQ607_002012 [Colletotrichum asianum]